MKKPMFMVFGMAELDPEDLHNIIADAVGEPRVHPNSGRMLRKADGASTESSGRVVDDGPSKQGR